MRVALLLATYAGLLGVSPCADAQIRFFPYGGYQTNASNYFVDHTEGGAIRREKGAYVAGVGAELDLKPGTLPVFITVRPSFETAFLDETTFFRHCHPRDFNCTHTEFKENQRSLRGSLDLTGSISLPHSNASVYGGVGVTYITYAREYTRLNDGNTSIPNPNPRGSSVGTNFLLGGRYDGGLFHPFIHGRYSTADPTPDGFSDASSSGTSISIQMGVGIGL